jgi:FkbM family methyltransferase
MWKKIAAIENRFQFLVQRALFRRSAIVPVQFKGLRFVLDYSGSDASGVFPCILDPMYRNLLGLLGIGPGLRVMDLGANVGGFMLMLLAEGYRPARAVAVELQPTTFSRLQFNLFQNYNPSKVVPLNLAVTCDGRPCKIPFSAGGTSRSVYETIGNEFLVVPGVTVDGLIEAHFGEQMFDLCKIDIEGAEHEILSGSSCSRLAQCSHVIIEIHPREAGAKERAIAALRRLGFCETPGVRQGIGDVYCFSQRR